MVLDAAGIEAFMRDDGDLYEDMIGAEDEDEAYWIAADDLDDAGEQYDSDVLLSVIRRIRNLNPGGPPPWL